MRVLSRLVQDAERLVLAGHNRLPGSRRSQFSDGRAGSIDSGGRGGTNRSDRNANTNGLTRPGKWLSKSGFVVPIDQPTEEALRREQLQLRAAISRT